MERLGEASYDSRTGDSTGKGLRQFPKKEIQHRAPQLRVLLYVITDLEIIIKIIIAVILDR
jgi:hypothetical protein